MIEHIMDQSMYYKLYYTPHHDLLIVSIIELIHERFLFFIFGRCIGNLQGHLVRETCMKQRWWQRNLQTVMELRNSLHVWTSSLTRWTSFTEQRRKSSWREVSPWRSKWTFCFTSSLNSTTTTKEALPMMIPPRRTNPLIHAHSLVVCAKIIITLLVLHFNNEIICESNVFFLWVCFFFFGLIKVWTWNPSTLEMTIVPVSQSFNHFWFCGYG